MKAGNIDVPTEQVEAFCRKWKVRELSLFGSVRRFRGEPWKCQGVWGVGGRATWPANETGCTIEAVRRKEPEDASSLQKWPDLSI